MKRQDAFKNEGLLGPICVALLVHGVILWGWQFNHTPHLAPNHEIDIMLVPAKQPQPEKVNTPSRSDHLAQLSSVIKDQLEATPTLKKRTISEGFHSPIEADYLSRWQSYIEQVGNAHYPNEAIKKNIRGQLRLMVALNKNGTVREVSIRQSSGEPLLDQAAIEIVKLAAPFEPLPPNLQDLDVLEIIRTWQFRGTLTAHG